MSATIRWIAIFCTHIHVLQRMTPPLTFPLSPSTFVVFGEMSRKLSNGFSVPLRVNCNNVGDLSG